MDRESLYILEAKFASLFVSSETSVWIAFLFLRIVKHKYYSFFFCQNFIFNSHYFCLFVHLYILYHSISKYFHGTQSRLNSQKRIPQTQQTRKIRYCRVQRSRYHHAFRTHFIKSDCLSSWSVCCLPEQNFSVSLFGSCYIGKP